ncbi:hypothetical protein KM043_001782 [Ampulex compressa]|nr:hypothetical protein KM043_001782 [Ampulex compressa]
MSLFKTKEWWKTVCGANESFDRHSLLVAPVFEDEPRDVVIVGSHAGYLRIYAPSAQWSEERKSATGYRTTDLIIETRLADCIVDVKAGKFVSGTQALRLAVLTPSKLLVYAARLAKGTTEEGDRCELEVAYEHTLPKFPGSLTTGPFGGVTGRDFLCVQCLDGTIVFYEQEVYAFTRLLRNRLLPEPMVYVPRNDTFVTASSSWVLECYRYQSVAELVREPSDGPARTLEPDSSYNIGEAVLDVEAVTLSSFEVGIVVLGERNLYCLKDGCSSLKYAKRLEYRPVCFRAYVIEPDGKLMVLVIAETSTLMIYEGTTLKWSAQLPFAPVAVTRAHLKHLDGALLVLSEEGRLEVCYLGSEPSLFIAPPLNRRTFDEAAAEQELMELRERGKRRKATGSDRLSEATTDAEVVLAINVSPDLAPCTYAATDNSEDELEGRRSMCRVTIELSSYTALRNVQISIDLAEPLISTKTHDALPNLCDRHLLQTMIYADGNLPPTSPDVGVTVSYENDRGGLCVLRKVAQLPLKMLLRACPPENTSLFTATIRCNEPPVGFTQLFPEFSEDHLRRQNWNALGLQHVPSGAVVTIVSGTSSNRYRVQSNVGSAMALVLGLLLGRLKEKMTKSIATSVTQSHLQLVHSQMEAHFEARQRIDKITAELELLTNQLRSIERRMLRATRERNTGSLSGTGLPFLLDITYDDILTHLEELREAREKRAEAGHGLRCGLKLLLLLVRCNVNEERYALLEAAIAFRTGQPDEHDWEEIANVALASLLRSVARKSGTADAKSPAWNPLTAGKDLTKLKKRLIHAMERFDACKENNIAEDESTEGADRATP